ncbi:hypothetical protein AVEN_123761-1 [Araneus ventricosus]|uniref:Uncharacterized protein n=1 Tax=Araneus ventricosus TaxID=182803 RepID=A0A4Y2BKJ6_ARAVE|nr:hypothetical protein AVEN_123761-1 [Araneus ventricosus]
MDFVSGLQRRPLMTFPLRKETGIFPIRIIKTRIFRMNVSESEEGMQKGQLGNALDSFLRKSQKTNIKSILKLLRLNQRRSQKFLKGGTQVRDVGGIRS